MHGGVTTGSPTSALLQKQSVILFANENFTGRAGHLRVAFEAKIIVALNQHLGIDGAVRTVTNDAAFTHRFVFKNKRPRLVAMTLRT